MTKAFEAFLASEHGKKLSTPEQIKAAEKVYAGISSVHNQTVDSCIELILKWGEVKQLTGNEDFKLLIEYIGKLKDDSAETR